METTYEPADFDYSNDPTGTALLRCLEHGSDCSGRVEYCAVPGGNAFPRCSYHFEQRLDRYENSIERYADSDVAPDWFDPTYCGERWDDDY